MSENSKGLNQNVTINAPEVILEGHGAMTSHGHALDDCRSALLPSLGLTAAGQGNTLARQPLSCCRYQLE